MPLLRLQLARSYLFLHTASHFAVFNCSDGPHSRKPPRLVLAQQLGQLSAEFLPPSEPPAAAQAEGTAAGAPAAAAAAETAPAAPQQPGVQLPSEGAGAGGGPRELLSSTSSSEPGVEAENPASGSGSEGCEQASREADACQACQSSGACEARFPPRAPAATAAPAALQRPTASLLAVDGGTGLVALGFGCGVVAVYESALPQRVRPPPPMAARLFQVRARPLCLAARRVRARCLASSRCKVARSSLGWQRVSLQEARPAPGSLILAPTALFCAGASPAKRHEFSDKLTPAANPPLLPSRPCRRSSSSRWRLWVWREWCCGGHATSGRRCWAQGPRSCRGDALGAASMGWLISSACCTAARAVSPGVELGCGE